MVKLIDNLNFNDVEIGDFFNRFALVSKYIGKNEQVEKYYLKAIDIIENDTRDDKELNLALIYTNIAKFYQDIGKFDGSFKFYEKAYKIYENIEFDDISSANFYNNFGTLFITIGELIKAELYLNKALNIKLRILGDKDFLTSVAYNDLAVCYEFQERYDEAEELYTKALEIRELLLEYNHPELAISYGNLGRLYLRKNRYKKSEKSFLKALEIQEEILTVEHISTLTTCNNLAFLYFKIKKYDKAIEYLEKTIFILNKNPQIDYSNSLLKEAYFLLNNILEYILDDFEKSG